jgi:hypothetical protein
VYDGLDSYAHTIWGGSSWSNRTRIEAYQRAGQAADHVVFRATSGDFCIRLAHEESSYLSIGTRENPIEVDGSALPISGSATGVKVTYSTGSGCAHHVRLSVRVYGAFHQGILLTDTHHIQVLGGSSRNNGYDPAPAAANKDHGLYIGGNTWDCLVEDFDTSGNAAFGIHEYGGETAGLLGRLTVRRGFHIGNGRLAGCAGVLLSGDDSVAERVTSSGNQIGVQCYRTARRCRFSGYLEWNRGARAYISPEAVDCAEIPLL